MTTVKMQATVNVPAADVRQIVSGPLPVDNYLSRLAAQEIQPALWLLDQQVATRCRLLQGTIS